MAGPILPISDPNQSTRIPASSISQALSQSSHSFRPARSVPGSSDRDISISRSSLSSVRTQPPMMVPAAGPKDGKDENGDADTPIEGSWQSVEMTQSGIVDKSAGEGPKYPEYPEYEEDERTGYARFSDSGFDQTGKLWPQIRKMKIMTLRSTEGFGIFTDLSKSETQFKFGLKPGSYLRFVCITRLTATVTLLKLTMCCEGQKYIYGTTPVPLGRMCPAKVCRSHSRCGNSRP